MATPLYPEATERTSTPRMKGSTETLFEYCDRLDHPDTNAGRTLANRWFSRMPEHARSHYASRLKSRSSTEHISALQEMYLFNLLLDAPEFEPMLLDDEHGVSRPDILVSTNEVAIAFVECTVCHPEHDEEILDKMQAELFRRCKAKVPSHVRLMITRAQRTSTQPSAKRLAHWINEWLATSKQPARTDEGIAYLGQRRYTDCESGWSMNITLALASGSDEGSEHLLLGQTHPAFWCKGTSRLAKAVSKKRRQHRQRQLSVVPAVSFNDFANEPEWDEIMRALYGDELSSVARGEQIADRTSTEMIWCSPCYPWSLHTMDATLWVRYGSTHSEFARRWPFDVIQVDVAKQGLVPARGPLAQ